jgi:hypothetical protein
LTFKAATVNFIEACKRRFPMKAIEFITTPKNGIITMPREYSNVGNTQVKVIILIEDTESGHDIASINSLLSRIKQKNIFSGISNPSEWQREIRNEW